SGYELRALSYELEALSRKGARHQATLQCGYYRVGRFIQAAAASRAIPLTHVPRSPERRRDVGEVAEEPPRVARIDDFLRDERLRGAERGAQPVDALLYLGVLCGWIGSGFDLGAIGRFEPAFHRQGAPLGRRPRVAQVVAGGVLVRAPRDAVDLAHE